MDVQACIDAYQKLAATVFEPKDKNTFLQRIFKIFTQATVKPLFDSAVLEREIKGIVRGNCRGGGNAAFFDPTRKCKV